MPALIRDAGGASRRNQKIPNDDGQVAKSVDWKPYRVSARSIESLTGLNSLADVAPATQNAIETRVDDL